MGGYDNLQKVTRVKGEIERWITYVILSAGATTSGSSNESRL